MSASRDFHIIKGILIEDRGILKNIYQDFFPGVKKKILALGGNEEDARDVFQDALVVIYMNARHNPCFLRVRFQTFLYQIVKYIFLKQKRDRRVDLHVTDYFSEYMEDDGAYIDEDIIEMERSKLVWKCISELNESCKKLLGYVLEGLTLKEITGLMGYSSIQYTKNRRTACKNLLIKKVRNTPEFKELKNESIRENTAIPRW